MELPSVKMSMNLNSPKMPMFLLILYSVPAPKCMPNFVVEQLRKKHDLANTTVGILGMAFKAESDDPRESLSYKLKKIIEISAARVLAADPYVKGDPSLRPEEQVEPVLAQRQFRGLAFTQLVVGLLLRAAAPLKPQPRAQARQRGPTGVCGPHLLGRPQ